MSLYIDLTINEGPLMSVAVTREGSDLSTDPDTVNTYRWRYFRAEGKYTVGHIQHRYGDGAVALASRVLTAITEHQDAARCDGTP